MSVNFSVRQLLACLNVSVFDPVKEPALKKIGQTKTETQTSFYNIPSLIIMMIIASVCFYGLRSYSFPAGSVLFIVCGLALQKSNSGAVRFFFRTYFFAGAFLLTQAVFWLSPVVMMALLFVLLVRSFFCPADVWQRIVLAVRFFFLLQSLPIVPLALLSFLGTAGLLFPIKGMRNREAMYVFAVLPVLSLLIEKMTGSLSADSWVWTGVFTSSFLLLIFRLYRDLEIGELSLFVIGALVLFFCGILLSVGIEGSIVLFLVAFFIDSAFLATAAILLFTSFLIVCFLSLPVSLVGAGIISLIAGCFFLLLRCRIKGDANEA